MPQTPNIIFVCEHGAAKSIVASAYFNKLAAENGLDVRSIARGTHPDAELGPKAVEGLLADGLMPAESVPQKLSPTDIESSEHVVTFCDLSDDEYHQIVEFERWDVPDISDGYEAARDSIVEHVNQLISSL